MPFFEVYVPARDASGNNVSLTVEAANWLGALQTGLVNLGEDVSSVGNVMCDMQDDGSIHVTDATTARVFRLREVSEPGPGEAPEPTFAMTADGKQRFKTAPQPVARSVSKPDPTDPSIGRPDDRPDVDEVLAEIFERAMDLFTERLNPDKIVNDLLDLAIEKVPSDAGSFYVANISGHELQFAAVRGPKAAEILASNISVPMGHGIAGFCAAEACALAVSDAQRDPRFAKEISDKIGYEAHSVLVVPLDKDGRCYGAIQLINKKGGTVYSRADLNILAAVGQQAIDLLSQVQT